MSPGARRLSVFGLTAVSSALAAAQMQRLLSANGVTGLELVWLVLFTLTFVWICLSFWTGVAGFIALVLGRRPQGLEWVEGDEPLRVRSAVLVPIHNEDPAQVFGYLEAMIESIVATGHGGAFDFFVLSDTTDPDIWVHEEVEWAALRQRLAGRMRVFYRHRRQNVGKKAGNIADFCRRWGSRYETMVVLDADSLMTGETLVTMARLMQKNPRAGIIQAPPVTVNGATFFARLQQLAGRIYGPINAAGLAFLQVGDSNYWGHNAIIRTRAFIDHCGLPELPGAAPFGGHILSHDFVEAALIRRGGYSVWLVPELGGSFEQSPPTLIDYASRDRRWCQGNLQHLPLVFADGLHPMSRLHLAMGVMSYVASLVCLSFLVAGLAVAVEERLSPQVFFPPHKTLFPIWRVFDHQAALWLATLSFTLLLVPKLLGLVWQLTRPGGARQVGGAARAILSVVLESVWSILIAPVMMLFQSTFVVTTLLGHKVSWGAQAREARRVGLEEAIERHGSHTILGLALIVLGWWLTPGLLWFLAPLFVGLVLSIPLSVVSSSEALGMGLKALGLLLTPEEREVPALLTRARELAQARASSGRPGRALARVLDDPLTNAVHLALIGDEGPRPAPDVLDRARRRFAHEGLERLSREETLALLADPATLTDLHLAAMR